MTTSTTMSDLHRAISWAGFEQTEPEFAQTVRERFGRYRHHILGTLRQDGSPRLTGLEADFRLGELWLGMMLNSRKALDLRRDPRFGLHANPGPGTDLDGGDVRVSGRALEVLDAAEVARYGAQIGHHERFHLFRTELTEVVEISIEGEEMVIRGWRPGSRLRTLRRHNEEESAREDS